MMTAAGIHFHKHIRQIPISGLHHGRFPTKRSEARLPNASDRNLRARVRYPLINKESRISCPPPSLRQPGPPGISPRRARIPLHFPRTLIMKINKLLGTCVAMAALYASGTAFAGREGWTSDFSAAKKQAAENHKNLLVDFTGSDWCGWCIKLDKEVFDHDEFKSGVKDNFVLVEIDFPQDKSILTPATIEQNTKLGEEYSIKGYPTILLMDPEGKPFAATGYQAGGPEAYVKHLNELLENKKASDEAFAKAGKEEGVAKAKALQAALASMKLEDAVVDKFYGDVAKQIVAADPKDETGYAKALATKQRLEKFQSDLGELAQKQDFDGALALVDKTLDEGGFAKDDTQQLIMTKSMILAQQGKFDDAIAQVDKALAVDPDGEMAEGIAGFKKRLEDAKAKAAEPKEKADEDKADEDKADEAKPEEAPAEKGA